MHMQLPKPIADYFDADKSRDTAAVSACFSENAVVKDENRTHVGRAAIRQWKANASTEYSYTVEPFALANDGDRTVVTSHVVGTFPGSPIDLRYFFVLDGDSIAELEIVS